MADDYEHEVDASNLVFGKEIDKSREPVPVLFNAEVAVLLQQQRKAYQDKAWPVPEAMTLTLEYCKRYANVKNLDDEGASQYLTNLRTVLEQWDFGTSADAKHKKSLHPFEVAAIANLMTTSSDRDEACALIPSLRRTDRLGDRLTDEQIDAVLDSVQNFLLGLGDAAGGGGGGGAAGGFGGGEEEDEEDMMDQDNGLGAGMGGGGGAGVGGDEDDEDDF